MAKVVRFHPLVANDLAKATSFYDGISVELGNRFRKAVRERIAEIKKRPESYGCIHEEMRAARLGRFPYVVLFEHGESGTHVLALFHTASDPS